jgi:hypothetical protein
MTTIYKKIADVLKEIANLKSSYSNNFGIFYAIDFDNKEKLGFHFTQEHIKVGDLGNYDNGCVEKNKDLIYISVFSSNAPSDLNCLVDIAFRHKDIISASRKATKKSAMLNRKGYNLSKSINESKITIFKEDKSEKSIFLVGFDAEIFIDGAIEFSNN